MAGGDGLRDEIAELETLLSQVKTAGNQRDLKQLLMTKQQQLQTQQTQQEDELMEEAETTPELLQAVPVKLAVHAAKQEDVGENINVYTEISRFGWEDDGYGKDKVTVHIMSGVDGVGDLPKENVSCEFTKDSFDLKILGLHGKNYRLVKNNLDKPIVPGKSVYRVKKNRISITLWKEDKNNTWMNLTAKNPTKQNRAKSSDPAAGIMDMMKDMYDEGDEDLKRTIAKAWSESHAKRQAGGADAF